MSNRIKPWRSKDRKHFRRKRHDGWLAKENRRLEEAKARARERDKELEEEAPSH
jgi:hypothetical protein